MQELLYILILLLGIATYASAVVQMLLGQYSPSFFSRGVWFFLGINGFAGVLLGGGSNASLLLAGTLFVGNTAVFAVSYKKGSREFGFSEKISLTLLLAGGLAWALLDAAFIGLIISLAAHFIGGIPTIWRVVKRSASEQAYHWYFFFIASVLSIIASPDKSLHTILFPAYFAIFDGTIIFLANMGRFTKRKFR
ncbi:MAG: hypothetical protein Q8Q13_01995 [bacterium]|nr:hypothetical protein [bacterium]